MPPPTGRLPAPAATAQAARDAGADADWLRRWRPVWSLLAGAAVWAFLGGAVGALAAPLAAVGTWVVIERAEPASMRREREAAVRELPHVVGLLADALRSGRSPTEALAVVADALPGPASVRLAEVVPRLRLGLDPAQVWAELATDPALGPLGRALARAQRTGAPVVATVERLADDLARGARADVEDRARAVGVKAAVPLGLCLLPAFVLIGIVPVVAGLLTELGL
ncbi:type II secretion system protein [Nocardioides sp. YIM 123512]|uniref:Type II secretion system protein n=1 Tax=Nocardioides flavescens TaxID=2691959 RepID=A0A6L7EY05_9ACTN|nr:type II secretion system protein [Nocardioides flavescens]